MNEGDTNVKEAVLKGFDHGISKKIKPSTTTHCKKRRWHVRKTTKPQTTAKRPHQSKDAIKGNCNARKEEVAAQENNQYIRNHGADG